MRPANKQMRLLNNGKQPSQFFPTEKSKLMRSELFYVRVRQGGICTPAFIAGTPLVTAGTLW